MQGDPEVTHAIGKLEGKLDEFSRSVIARLDDNKAYAISVSLKVDEGHARLEEKIDTTRSTLTEQLQELRDEVETENKFRDRIKGTIKWTVLVVAPIVGSGIALWKFLKGL